jgi:hypothetical protein
MAQQDNSLLPFGPEYSSSRCDYPDEMFRLALPQRATVGFTAQSIKGWTSEMQLVGSRGSSDVAVYLKHAMERLVSPTPRSGPM